MWKIPHLGGYGLGHFVSVGTILVRRVLFPIKFQDQLLYIVRCEQVGGGRLTPGAGVRGGLSLVPVHE